VLKQPRQSASAGRRRQQRGFSLIELLVAIIIIGILVAVLLPVVSNRTAQARLARAESDIENLSSSMERVAIDTGYYIRLFALNDVLNGDGLPIEDANDNFDGITDYVGGTPSSFIQFPTNNSLFIDPGTGDFAAGLNRDDIIARFQANETGFDGTLQWNGPYINWQKDTNNFRGIGFDDLQKDGIPDDPWGNNYLFFTRAGMVLEPDGVFAESASVRNQGGYDEGGPFDCLIFDRPTILSTGPNGLPGNGQTTSEFGDGNTDDLVRFFGK